MVHGVSCSVEMCGTQQGLPLTFGQCDLSDTVALSKPHRHGADQVSWHLLLSVLFPTQGQGRVAACGDQMLIKQAVLRA